MNPNLSSNLIALRGKFLFTLRKFFALKNYLEIDTPKLKKVPGMEPFLSPFTVVSPDGQEKGYLVTSPEYSLKQVLSLGIPKIYEICSVYRSGERGGIHTAEFLMLEFYEIGIDEFQLMQICMELFDFLNQEFRDVGYHVEMVQKFSILSLFQKYLSISDSRSDLESFLIKKYPQKKMEFQSLRYDELFFLVFLNEIEPNLQNGIFFLYDYPAPLAALAKVENGRARRFEIYWNGVELGNAFYECNSPDILRERFQEEQLIRKSLGKEVFELDTHFFSALDRGIKDASGIAMGLDRLLMVFLGHTNLKFLSPYYGSLTGE